MANAQEILAQLRGKSSMDYGGDKDEKKKDKEGKDEEKSMSDDEEGSDKESSVLSRFLKASMGDGESTATAGFPEPVSEEKVKARAAGAEGGNPPGEEGGQGQTAKKSGRRFMYLGESFIHDVHQIFS